MFDFMLWLTVTLSVIVMVQIVWFMVLALKIVKRQPNEKKEEKLMAAAGLVLLAVFPFHLLAFSLLLLAEIGILTFAIVSFTKKLKAVGETSVEEAEAEEEMEYEAEPLMATNTEGPSEDEVEMVAELMREEISMEEAHGAITDEMASHFVIRRKGKRRSSKKKSIINVKALSHHFESDDHVNLLSLKAKGLIPHGTDYVKILASGHLDKKLTVEAHNFSADAIKMIILTGGSVIETA